MKNVKLNSLEYIKSSSDLIKLYILLPFKPLIYHQKYSNKYYNELFTHITHKCKLNNNMIIKSYFNNFNNFNNFYNK
jgi:hypothetical protein